MMGVALKLLGAAALSLALCAGAQAQSSAQGPLTPDSLLTWKWPGDPQVSPDGRRVAYRWVDDRNTGWVRFVDTATGEATAPTELPTLLGAGPSSTWRPDGRRYVGYRCSDDTCSTSSATVVDSSTGELVRERELPGVVFAMAYVDEGRTLLVGTDERTTVVDAETLRSDGKALHVSGHIVTPIGDGSTAMVQKYSADGTSVRWRVIAVDTGEVLSVGALGLSVSASVASPDGSAVAMAGETGEIVTIDVLTGDARRRSTGLGAKVLWLDYSEDGELLVSAAEDGGVSLWDATTLDLLGTVYPPHLGDPAPADAQFVGDSHDVAIASYDGRVYRWQTDRDRALAFACQMAGRDLTHEEWQQFLPAQPYRSVCPDG
jgi:WD40 repeat protein